VSSQRFSTLGLLSEQTSHTALVPKDWLSGPVFKPGIQRKNAPIIVGDRTWCMGANNPLTEQPSADIDLSHIRIVLTILSFWSGGNPLHLSMGELARRCASSRGGRYFRDLRRKMEDLRNYWISVVEKDGTTRSFPLLQKIEVVTKPPRRRGNRMQKEIWLDKVELAESFAELLRDWTQIMHLNLGRSKHSQAISPKPSICICPRVRFTTRKKIPSRFAWRYYWNSWASRYRPPRPKEKSFLRKISAAC
jgi:hypothetical protein